MSTRAIIYTRISKDRSEQTSTASQEAVCRAYAEAHGWEVVALETDKGRSAFNGKARPGWRRVQTAVDAGAVDVVLVWALDRAVRSTRQLADLLARLDDAGAAFASATQPLDTSSPMGRAMVQIIGVLAELESAMKSERTSAWHEQRNIEGKAPVGPRVFGYDKDRDGRYVPNRAEAPSVVDVFERLDRGEAMAAIARHLNAEGVRTVKGREWGPMTVRVLAANPSVAGLREVDGVLVEAPWEPLVGREQWERVSGAIGARKGTQAAHTGTLLGGLLVCGRCGSVLHHTPHTQNRVNRYVCSGKGCSLGIMDTVDEFVSDAVIGTIDAAAWSDLRSRANGRQAEHLIELQDDLTNLARQYGAGELTRAEWEAMRPGLVSRISAAESAVDAEPLSTALPDVADLAASWSDLTTGQRRLVISTVLESVTISPARRGYNRGLDSARVALGWRV